MANNPSDFVKWAKQNTSAEEFSRMGQALQSSAPSFNRSMSSLNTPNQWYAGQKPTLGETYARIRQIGQTDPAAAQKAYTMFKTLQADKGSEYYRQYAQPTNQAVQNLQNLGFDTSVLNDGWFAQNEGWIRSHLNTSGTTNTPSSSVKKKSWEEQVAYQLYQYQKSEAQTKQAEKEYQAAMEEAKYWTNFGGRNYSDQQVYDKVREGFEKKYPTLAKMESEQYRFSPLELNRAVDWSDDVIMASIWEARNPEYNGGIEGALAAAAMGEGNQWQENQEITSLLNPNDSKFQPYAVGGTSDKAFRLFGITEASNEWINENSHLLYDGTPEQQEAMKSLISANDFTNEAETAIAALDSWIESKKGKWKSFDKAKADLDELLAGKKIKIRDGRNRTEVDISALNKLDASIGKDGKVGTAALVPTTRALNYKYADVLDRIQQIVDENTKVPGSLESLNSMQGYVTSTTSDYAKAQEANWARGQEAKANAGKGKQPEQPANIQPFTEDQIALEKAGRDKIMDAADVVEDIATEDEQSVMRNAGTPSFDLVRDNITVMKNDPSYVGTWTAEAQKQANIEFFDTNIQNMQGAAMFLNAQQRVADNKPILEEFESKYGDVTLYMDATREEQPLEQTVTIGDGLHASFDYDQQTGTYTLQNLYDDDGNDLSLMGDMFFTSADEYGAGYNRDGVMAAVGKEEDNLNARSRGIREAADRYASASDEEKRYIDQMRQMKVALDKDEQYVADHQQEFNEQMSQVEYAFGYLEMLQTSAEWMGADTSGVDEMMDALQFATQFYDEPQLVCDSNTKLQEYDEICAAYGAEATRESRAKYLNDHIESVDAQIAEIEQKTQYYKDNGFTVPENVLRHMQYKLEDLQYDRKDYEYGLMMADTDPEEMERLSKLGDAFYNKGLQILNDSPERSSAILSFMEANEYATEQEEQLFYYLIGKSLEEQGISAEQAEKLFDDDESFAETSNRIKQYTKEAQEFVDHMSNDDHGAWTSRMSDDLRNAGKELVESGPVGGVAANLLGTGMTGVESLSSAYYILDRALGNKRINPKSGLRNITVFKESTRAETFASIDDFYKDNPTMKTLARLGYEIYSNRGDSLVNAMTFGWLFPEGEGIGKILSNIGGAAPMGFTAALTAAANAVERGASTEQAWAIAGATFIAETFTEGITYSNIRGALGTTEELTKDTVKGFLKDWLVGEGLEEMVGESINDIVENAADRFIMADASEHAAAVDKLVSEGYDRGEAEAIVRMDEIKGVLHTAIVSYLSAGTDVAIKAGKAAVNTTGYYATVTRALQQTGHQTSMLQEMRKGREANRQALKEAQANEENTSVDNKTAEQAEQTEVQTESPVAPAEGESTAAPENEIRKAAATDIVTLEKTKKSDMPAQTAALASVLDTGKGNTVSSDANAAAVFMTGVMGEDATTTVQQVLLGAGWANVDQTKVKQALQNAALGNGLATALVQTDTFKTANAQQKAQMLVDTLEQDNSNPNVRRNVSEKVRTFNQTMNGANQAAVQGLFDQAAKSKQEAQRAAMETAQAEQMLDEASQKLEAAKADVQQKSNAVVQNPSDDNVKQQADAVSKMNSTAESQKQMEQHLDNQKQAQQEKEAKARKDAEDAMNASRQTGEQAVNQMEQQKAEKEQYRQGLMDNGIINREYDSYSGETELFATDAEMEARRKANFAYDNDGSVLFFGEPTDDVKQALEDAGFYKIETHNGDTGETGTAYEINQENISVDQLKALNDFINDSKQQRQAEEDERTGKAQEDDDNARIDAFIDSSAADEETKEKARKLMKERVSQRREGKIRLDSKLTDAESMLALGALQRKIGVPIMFSDNLGDADGEYKDGVIHLNKRKASDGSMRLGRALVEVAMHEITHSLQDTKHYKQYRDIVIGSLFGFGDAYSADAYNNAIKQKQNQYAKHGETLTPEQAEQEIVADFAKKNLADKDVVQRFMDAGMGGRMRNMLHNINQALKNFFANMTGEDRMAAENLRKAERAFQKALVDRSKTTVHPSADQFSIAQFAQATDMRYDEKTQTLYDSMNRKVDGVKVKVTRDMISKTPVGKLINLGLNDDICYEKDENGKVKIDKDGNPIPRLDEDGNVYTQKTAALDMFTGLMNMVAMLKDQNLVWEIAGSTLESTFSALKANSDTQYHDTVDFGTICAKTQAIVNVMSRVMMDRLEANKIARAEGRMEDISYGLTRDDVLKIYNETHKAGLSVPCPVCYVFSHWMGVPSLLGQMSRFQHDYIAVGVDENGNQIKYGDIDPALNDHGYANFDVEETQKNALAYIEEMHRRYKDKEGVDDRKSKINSEIAKKEKRYTKIQSEIVKLEAQLENEKLAKRSRDAAEKKLAAFRAELVTNAEETTALDEELREVEAYNWITQSLCKQDEYGNWKIDEDFRITPDEILMDLRRTGEFADRYAKNWGYRTTRGAGMGKSILPYSGASLGDILNGSQTRLASNQNPFFTGYDDGTAEKKLQDARTRARRQNLIGGQRLQSTSDFRPEWGLDYIMAFLELQAAQSNAQMYTKVSEFVDLAASTGGDVNMSIMGSGNGWHEATAEEIEQAKTDKELASRMDTLVDDDGIEHTYVMDFSDVTGMEYGIAKSKSKQWDSAQMILVGMNDTHIRLAMKNADIDFIIPWHSSGNSKDVLSQLVASVEETLETSSDYTKTQGDKFVTRKERYTDENGKKKTRSVDDRTEDQKTMWNARIKILTGIADKDINETEPNKGGLTNAEKRFVFGKDANPFLKDLYQRFYVNEGDKCYHVSLTSAQAKQIFPYEYWQTDVTKPGGTKETADENGLRFIQYCQAMGVVPRFSGIFDKKTGKAKEGNFAGAIYDKNGKITGYDPAKMDKGYWKLLIDRKMYDNEGNYRDQQVVNTSNIRIGSVEGKGKNAKLSKDSMLPTETSAKYGIPALEQKAAYESERIIQKPFDLQMNPANDGGQKLYSDDFTDAEIDDLLRQAGVEYQDAVARGDMETAQNMVDEAANQAGYTIQAFHGSPVVNITNFDKSKLGNNTGSTDVPGFFFVDRKDYAEAYLAEEQNIKPEYKERYEKAQAIYAQYHDQFSPFNGYYKVGDRYGEYVQRTHPEKFKGFYDPESQDYKDFENARMFLRNVDDDRLKLKPQYTNTSKQGKVYGVRLKMENPYVYDAQGEAWNPSFWGKIKQAAASDGGFTYNGGVYDGIIVKNFYDFNTGESGTEYVVFEPEQIKSSDPVTYDDNGNVIPLSERFDINKSDIRYSFGDSDMTDAEIDDLLRRAGVVSAEDIDSYHDKTSRPLEGKSLKWSSTEGPAERAFGGEGGMLSQNDELAQRAVDYVMSHNKYFPDTNEEQIHRAMNWIGKNGFAKCFDSVTSKNFDYRSADGQARMVSMMAVAAAMGDDLGLHYQVQLADAFNRQGTDLGRALQSRKLFKLMTPAGRISLLQKMMNDQAQQFASKGMDVGELKFSDWVLQAAAYAESEEEFRQVQAAAAAELATQLPISWKERLNSLRMLSMLANPRTHIRNVIGNALFVPAVGLKNKIGAVLEKAFVEEGERTKTLRLTLPADIKQFASEDALLMKDTLTGEAKYEQGTLVAKAKKPLGEVGTFLSEFNSKALEGEDWFFLKGHYRRALGGWMMANGYTVDQVKNDASLLEKGRAYAIEEAQKATYRDFNALAKWLNNPKVAGKDLKGTQFLLNAVLPFKKTPMNILRRGIEYSPVGIARSIKNYFVDFKRGNMTANEVIDRFTSGLSGTAAMMVGYWLAGAGAASCGFDDDDWDEELKGNQKYSINPGKALNAIFGAKIFGEDVTYTMDWAAPMAMPFFVGVASRKMAEDGGFDIGKFGGALATITEPTFNLSCLDGVNTILKTNSYGKNNAATQIIARVLSNYATSYVPSVLGAIARTIDDTQRKAYVEKKDKEYLDVNGTLHYASQQAKNKIPGLSQTSIPVRDVWGNAKTSSFAERLIENFISPGYVENYKEDPVVLELGRLFDSVKDIENAKRLVPSHAETSIKVGQTPHDLTAQQYDIFDRVHGETQYKLLKELFNNKTYQQMTDDDAKAEIVSKVYEYANKVAKNAVFSEYTYDIETIESLMQSGLATEYSQKMMKALEQGDVQAYDDYLESYVDAVGDENEAYSKARDKIRNKYSEEYKQAYQLYLKTGEKQYEDKMTHIEELLDDSGFDFKIADWESSVEEKLGY